MKSFTKCMVLFLIVMICFAPHLFARESLLIQNARLIDGTDAPMQEDVSILIVDGKIAQIGKQIAAPGIPQLNVDGAYVLPGLIDSHIHLMWPPGTLLNYPTVPHDVKTWETTWGKYTLTYLRAYVACGVTTVLDTGAPSFVIKRVREHLDNGNPGPRFLYLGEFFTAAGGYCSQIFDPVSTPEEIEAKLDEMQKLGVKGIKVPIEEGWLPRKAYPIHSKQTLERIKQGAELRGLPLYVHASTEKSFNQALDVEPYTLVHTLIARKDEQVSAIFVNRMAQKETYQQTTLSNTDSELALFYPERLNEPLLDIVVPKSELLTARDPNAGYAIHKKFVRKDLSWLLKPFAGILSKLAFNEKDMNLSLQNSKKAIYDLHKAGVPIVMGSDSPCADFVIYQFHGFTSLREIELLGESGLSPKEAIKAATVTPAKMLGLEHEIGTVEVGKCADLIVLKDNPLNDLRALRSIQFTVKDGVANTPKGWMAQ